MANQALKTKTSEATGATNATNVSTDEKKEEKVTPAKEEATKPAAKEKAIHLVTVKTVREVQIAINGDKQEGTTFEFTPDVAQSRIQLLKERYGEDIISEVVEE